MFYSKKYYLYHENSKLVHFGFSIQSTLNNFEICKNIFCHKLETTMIRKDY